MKATQNELLFIFSNRIDELNLYYYFLKEFQ